MSFLIRKPPADVEANGPDKESHLPQARPSLASDGGNSDKHHTSSSNYSSPDMDIADEHSSITNAHAIRTDSLSDYEARSMFIDDREHRASKDELCEIEESGVSDAIRNKWNNHKFTPYKDGGPICEIIEWREIKAGDNNEQSIVDASDSQAKSDPDEGILSPSSQRNKGKNKANGILSTSTTLVVANQEALDQSAPLYGSVGLDPSEEIVRLKTRLAQLEGKLPASVRDADPSLELSVSGHLRPSTEMNRQAESEGGCIQIEDALDGEEDLANQIEIVSQSEKCQTGHSIRNALQAASTQDRPGLQKRIAGMDLENGKSKKRHRTKMGFGNNLRRDSRRKKSDFTGERMLELLRPEDPFQSRHNLGNIHHIEASTIEEQINKIRDELKGDPNADLTRVNREIQGLATARSYLGRNRCRAMHGKWKVVGVETPLYHYRLWGLGWMLEREKEDEKIHGGILADDVGLGKTLQALSLIVVDFHISVDTNQRHKRAPTLVVVPPNLLWQWQEEVQKHCPDIAYLTYREKDDIQLNSLVRMDIVFITYHELLRNYPPPDAIKELDELGLAPKIRRQKFNEAAGIIYNCQWRRVIFDEAHAMKNIKTITCRACLELGDRAKHRWALTGTPIPNGVKELVPYMKLIKAPCTQRALRCYNNKDIGKCDRLEYEKALDELAPLVATTILKRGVRTLFLGRALFNLPQAHVLPNAWISFSREEMHIYRRIEDYFRKKINKHLKAAALRGRIPTYLAWALRLRQATAHPFLLESLMRDYLTIDDIRALRQELRAIGAQTRLLDHLERREIPTPEDHGSNEIASNFSASNYNRFDMDSQLELVVMVKEAMCRICQDLPMDPLKTDCGHIFCGDCLQGHLDFEDDEGLQSHSCPECDGPLRAYEPTELPAVLLRSLSGGASPSQRPSTTPLAMGSSSASRRRQQNGSRQQDTQGTRGPGDDLNCLQPTSDVPSSFVTMCDENPALALERSAKTTVVRDIIIETLREHPNDKLIVFTQWTTIGRILGRILDAENIGYYYLFGCLNPNDKKRNIKCFHDNPDASVLIAGLKCGGQGLNLTGANRVINIDLWWNYAVEQQAFGRVFRIGQIKETYLYRIMVKNSIDGRLLKLQNDKLKQINAALKDYDPVKQRLSASDVAGLFGRIRREPNSQLVVERDYEDDVDEGHEDDEDDRDEDDEDDGDEDDNWGERSNEDPVDDISQPDD